MANITLRSVKGSPLTNNEVDANFTELETEVELATTNIATKLGAASNLSDLANASTALTNLGLNATSTEINYSSGVTSSIQTQLDAKSSSIAVTVADIGSGNKFYLDGTEQQTGRIIPSVEYIFDQSASSNSGHPLLLSITADGTHGAGVSYTTGVTAVGTPGSAGAYTKVVLEQDAPDNLYYYCSNHAGMGADITVRASGGSVTSVGTTGTVNGITLTGTVSTSGNLTLGGTLANVDLTSQITGTLPVANGGTGVTSKTGTGAAVLGTAPTITGMTLAGEVVGANQTVSAINLKDYGEITNAIGNATGAKTIDMTLGNSVTATTTGATTWTFTNPTATDALCGFSIKLDNGGSAAQIWPASVDWPAATAPTLTASGTDVLVFITCDGGTTWYGFVAGLALS